MSYGPYDNFLEVRADGSIVVRGDTPTDCARCGRAHFSWRAALKCSRAILDEATSTLDAVTGEPIRVPAHIEGDPDAS